jgi:hypothetical protein
LRYIEIKILSVLHVMGIGHVKPPFPASERR